MAVRIVTGSGNTLQSYEEWKKGGTGSTGGSAVTSDRHVVSGSGAALQTYDEWRNQKDSDDSMFSSGSRLHRNQDDDLQNQWLKKYQGKGYESLASSLRNLEEGEEKNWLREYAQKVDYDEKMALDLDAYEAGIQDLLKQYDTYKNAKQGDITAAPGKTAQETLMDLLKETGIEIDRRKQYLTLAKRLQEQAAGQEQYSQVTRNADFAQKSGYDSGNQEIGYQYMNADAAGKLDLEQKYGQYAKQFADRGFDSLSEDEKAIYNYYMNTGDRDEAARYLKYLEETLQIRKGTEADAYVDALVEDNPKANALRYAFMANVGYDQHLSGLQGAGNLMAGKDEYVPATATQVAGQLVREDLGQQGKQLPAWLGGGSTGQMLGDLISTTANMAPSMVMGLVSPNAGAAMMGVSAAGGAYQEKINEGFTKEQARKYGIAIGASEAALGAALGGIKSLGGAVTNHVVDNALKGIKNGVGRFFAEWGTRIGSEALEEGIQEILTPMFSNLLLNTDEKVDWSQVAYSALLGGLSAGVLEVGDAYSGAKKATADNKAAVAENATTEETSAVGDKRSATQLTEDIDSFAKQYGKQAGAVKQNYLEGQDLQEYEVGFQAAYAIGKEGGSKEGLQKVQYLSQAQKDIAYSMGRDAAAVEKRDAEKARVQKMPKATLMSEDGESSPVSIAEVVSMDDDAMTFRLEDGSTVTDEALTFDKGQQVLSAVWETGMDVKAANAILADMETNPATDADQAAGIDEAYRYGSHGYSMEQLIKNGTDAAALTENQRKAAYDAGVNARQAAAVAAPAVKAKKGTSVTGVYLDGGSGNVTAFSQKELKGLTGKRKAGVQAAMALQKIGVGGNFYFYESYINDAGERVYKDANGVEKEAPNGWYDSKDDSIHIDLNAGGDASGLTLYTLSHELTHFVEKRSKEKYRALADFLAESYGKQGESVDALVIAKQKALSESRGEAVSYEEAYSEFIADSMEAMLADGNVLEKLADLKTKDRGLFDEIRKFFDNLVKKIRDVYAQLVPDSEEGKMVLQMKDQIEQIQQLFAEALTEAETGGETGDVQFSDRADKKITMSMTDSERTEILKNKVITASVYEGQADQTIKNSKKDLESHRDTLIKSALLKIGQEFNVFTDYNIADVDVDIRLSKGNLKESISKKIDPVQIAKLLPIMKTAVENAVGIERHANRYFYDNDTVSFENLLGGYVDGDYFIPIRFGLKHSKNGGATLYLIVDQNKINLKKIKAEVAKVPAAQNVPADTSRSAFTVSLASVVSFVNSGDLLRYIPDNMLSQIQKTAKWNSIAETVTYTNNKNDRKYVDFIRSGNIEAAKRMVQQAAKVSGYDRMFFHGAKKGGGFTRFREWSYFTENKQYAERYAQRDNPGSLYTVYGKMENPFDTRDSEAKAIFEDIRSEYGLSELQDTGLPDWTDGYDITDYIDENDLDYDGVILDEGGDMVDGKPVSRGLSYVIRNSEQVKSADVITYDDDGNIIPISKRFDTTNKDIRYQERTTGTSNRALLAGAFEELAQKPDEREFLQKYRENVAELDKQELKLQELRRQIREISFGKGPRDMQKLKELQDEATKTANRIDNYDKRLLGLEATVPLKRVLEREKVKVKQRANAHRKAAMEEYRERRERTFMRHKIEKVVKTLNDLLTKPTKTRHVLPGLQKPVAEMLDALNMGSDEKQNKIYQQLSRYQELLAIEKAKPDPQMDVIEAYKVKIEKLQERGENLSENISRLKKAYAEIKKSTDPEIAGAYMPEIEEQLEIMSQEIGDTPLQDMNLQQMDIVYNAYKMVLHNVTHANKLFGQLQKITAAEMTKEAAAQIRSNGIDTKDPPKKLKDAVSKLNEWSWQNLRPVDAFRRTGSEKMMELFWGLVDGMAERGKMAREIRDYLVKARKDSHYSKFDFKKAETYTTVDGKKMKLTLGEKMSIYAYSKREAAFDHMAEGGFTYAEAQAYKDDKGVTRYHNNAGGTWRLSLEDLNQICGSLTEDQRRYADTMQKFLTEFGQRGNGVSRALFGIDLFKEQNYFPLMSNHDYLNSVQTDLGATQTAVSLKNSGFTKSTKPGANNPIVLKSFDDVCLEHLDKMMNYISMTLPLENLRKVYDNVSFATPESEPQSTKALIGAVFGKEAKQYFDQFLKDANGTKAMTGARNPLASLFGKSKAAAVSANVSVVVQQISAVVRATAEISPAHLITAKSYGQGATRGKQSYEEMMKYSGIANIKDMGGFDVGIKTGLKDYIGYEEAPRSAEKNWASLQDVFGMGAEFMDKVGWTMIWNGVKREVASRKQYTINSKEFFDACAERFNEVVVKTQVFDSVLSRSGFMRSERDSVQYLTSFMGEPTVTAGMVFNSHLDVIRAVETKKNVGYNVKKLARTDAALIMTLVINGILKAIPYAARDDDEDESFWERWAKHFGDSLRGDLNPLSLLPVTRDIGDILAGRTVERPDLALLSDLISAGEKAAKALMDEDAREELQAEDYWQLAEDVLGAIGNMAGVPVQNIWRDIESYIRLYKDSQDNIETVELKESFQRGFTGEEKTKLEGIYDALIRGDTARIDALKATYKTESSYESAVRKALRKYDPRIKEMANARYEYDYDRLEKLSYEIESEGIFDMATIRAAYESERTAQAKERGITLEEDAAAERDKESTVLSMEEYYSAIRNGNEKSVKKAYDALFREKKNEYYLDTEAEDSIESSVVSKVKGEYLDDDISRENAIDIMIKYGGKSLNEAQTEVKKWEFQLEYNYAWGSRDRCYRSGTITRSQLVSAVMDIEGASWAEAQEYVDFLDLEMQNQNVDITAAEAGSYFEHAKPYGISVKTYLDYKERTKGIENDKDANGKAIAYTAVQKIMTVINSLPISSDQKDALARSNGWADKTIQKYKLW